MEIKCKKITCGFNQSTVCMAREISVDANQGCNSFTKKSQEKEIKKSKVLNRFETSDDLTGFIHSPNKNVNCQCTECQFNKCKECQCNGITLSDNNKTAMCVSHIKK